MGYKGIDNKDLQISITSKKVNDEILKAYLTADQQQEVQKEFAKLEKTLTKEKSEIIKSTSEELKKLKRELISAKVVEYGNLISGKITTDMMR